jgi:hypothetical protein
MTRVVRVKDDSKSIERAIGLAKKLIDTKPFPASIVFVMTNEYLFRAEILPYIPERAHSSRCAVKDEEVQQNAPPSSGCVWLPAVYLDQLSDDALAAILAHELGHIDKGHRSWTGAAEPLLIQWEADEAATERLSLAGFCAGEAMRKYAVESTRILGPGWTHPWRFQPIDCKAKISSLDRQSEKSERIP